MLLKDLKKFKNLAICYIIKKIDIILVLVLIG